MPSASLKQHRAMEAAAKGEGTLGIPQKVAQEYLAADKGRKFGKRKSRSDRHPRSHDEFMRLGED